MKKQKIKILVCSLLLLGSLTACGGNSPSTSSVSSSSQSSSSLDGNNENTSNSSSSQSSSNSLVNSSSSNSSESSSSSENNLLIEYKNKAIEQLDLYITSLVNRIPYDVLKTDTLKLYNEQKKEIELVDSIDKITPCVNKIKDALENYALTESKKIAVSKLDEVINESLDKIPNQALKEDFKQYSKGEIAKLNSISKLEDIPSTLQSVILETKTYVTSTLSNLVKEYLRRLTAIETSTAYDYLPKAMHPSYAKNIVSSSSIDYDFTSFTDVSSINQSGYGEQWQMVVENINQSVAMAKVFNIAQTALNAAGTAVDIYITNSYAEEMSYSFNGNGFEGKFEFKNSLLYFSIDLTNAIEVPGFGIVKPVIKMVYDVLNEKKGMFINLGDAYKVKYTINENGYEMATTYGLTISGKSASRSSYLSVTKDDKKTIGHIYEYTTIQGSDMIKACADFYVENNYVSVVGNKSSGMIAFKGFINELYSADEGRLLGYEVREELTFAGITGTYNTLWFNIWDIEGINSIKVTEKTDDNASGKSTVDVYLNESNILLSPTYNSKLTVKTSRKYDVELRNRYYYTYDEENDKYVKNKVEVPMMFIQEGDNFNSFSSDIFKDNGIKASVKLAKNHLNKILSDYDTLIDIFISNKDKMSSETIIAYLEEFE